MERLSEGAIVKVLLELEADGAEAIGTQALKLSEDTCRVPEQEVFDMLLVRVVVFIASEKVMAIVVPAETAVAASAGEIVETVGAEVSTVKLLTLRVLAYPTASVTVRVQSA